MLIIVECKNCCEEIDFDVARNELLENPEKPNQMALCIGAERQNDCCCRRPVDYSSITKEAISLYLDKYGI